MTYDLSLFVARLCLATVWGIICVIVTRGLYDSLEWAKHLSDAFDNYFDSIQAPCGAKTGRTWFDQTVYVLLRPMSLSLYYASYAIMPLQLAHAYYLCPELYCYEVAFNVARNNTQSFIAALCAVIA